MKKRHMLLLEATTNSAATPSPYVQEASRSQRNKKSDTTPELESAAEAGSMISQRSQHRRTKFSPLYLGEPRQVCPYCGAIFWKEEHVSRGCQDAPIYYKCCRGGSIVLALYKPPPDPLLSLLTGRDTKLSNHFDGVTTYNSMFAMTSMGVNVINSVNGGQGPYGFKINGQLYYRIGSLVPLDGRKPEYWGHVLFI